MVTNESSKSEKVNFVKQLYRELTIEGIIGTKAVKEILRRVTFDISERSIWTYKKIWDAGKEVDVSDGKSKREKKPRPPKKPPTPEKKKQVVVPVDSIVIGRNRASKAIKNAVTELFHKNPTEIQWLDPNANYSQEYIRQQVHDVCSELTIGHTGFMQILDSKGITIFLWQRWMDEDEELSVIFQNAKDQQLLSYNNRIQDLMKKLLMAYLSFDEIVEEVLEYEFVEIIDPENKNEVVYKEVPSRRLIKKKPQKPDNSTIKMVHEMMREVQRKAESVDDDIKDILNMSEYEISKYIQDIQNERERRNNNATGETDGNTTEQATEDSERSAIEPTEAE